jgi:hypothetical protein
MNQPNLFYALTIMNILISSLWMPMDSELFMGASKYYNIKQRISIEKNINNRHH